MLFARFTLVYRYNGFMSKLATPILREVEELRRAGLSEADIAKGTGAGRSTVRAWLASTRSPSGGRSERLIELAAIVERLGLVMDPGYVPIWLNKPVPALDYAKPIELIGSGEYLSVARVISGLEGQVAV
jgi:transcriptional regulator with XRE-family HTH domain